MKKGKLLKGLLFAFSLLITMFVAPSYVGAEGEVSTNKAYILDSHQYLVIENENDLADENVGYSSGIRCYSGYENCTYVPGSGGSIDFSLRNQMHEVKINVSVTPIVDGVQQAPEIITLSRYYFVSNLPGAPSIGDENIGSADAAVSTASMVVTFNSNIGKNSSGTSANDALAGANLWIGTTGSVSVGVTCSTSKPCTNIRYVSVTEYQLTGVTLSGVSINAIGGYTTIGSQAYRSQQVSGITSTAYGSGLAYSISSSYGTKQLYVTVFYFTGSTYEIYADMLTMHKVSGEATFNAPTISQYTAPSGVPDGKFSYSASLTASTSKIAIVYDSSTNRAIRDEINAEAAAQSSINYNSTPSCVIYYAANSCTLTKTTDDAYTANATAHFKYTFRKMSGTTPSSYMTNIKQTKPIELLQVDSVTTSGCNDKSGHKYCNNGDTITVTFGVSASTYTTITAGAGITINKLYRKSGSDYSSSTFVCSRASNKITCVYTVSNSTNLDVLDNNNLIVDGIYLAASTQIMTQVLVILHTL